MWRRRLALLVSVVAACGRPDAGRMSGSSTAAVTTDASSGVAMSGEWPPDLGTVLVVPSDTENAAIMLYPASPPALTGTRPRLALLTSGGDTLVARVSLSNADSASCGDAPMVRLSAAAPLQWSLGIAAVAKPLHSDSLEAITQTDSLLYATETRRLAASLPAAKQSRLAGLPYALLRLRRLRTGDTTILVAHLARRVNQEANPAEERTLLVAESGSGRFEIVYSKRSEGTEEAVTHYDLLGAFRTASTIYLVVSADSPTGSTVEILERSAGGWRVRWSRALSC